MSQAQAILARLSLSAWSASRIDREVGREVARSKGASDRAGRYTKNLIDPHALAPVRAVQQQMRLTHYDLTRPWDDGGRRLLPGSLIARYKDDLKTLEAQHAEEVDRFIAAYPELVERAKIDLGHMWEISLYPHPDSIRGFFRVEVGFEPIPDGSAIPVSLEDREEMAREIEKQSRERLAESAQALFYRVRSSIDTLGGKLRSYGEKLETGERTKFHSSVLNEIEGLVDILPKLNVENDPFLNGITERMKTKLLAWRGENLKEDAGARNLVLADVDAILKRMDAHA